MHVGSWIICFSSIIRKMFNHVKDMEKTPFFTVCFVYIAIIHLKNKENHFVIPTLF